MVGMLRNALMDIGGRLRYAEAIPLSALESSSWKGGNKLKTSSVADQLHLHAVSTPSQVLSSHHRRQWLEVACDHGLGFGLCLPGGSSLAMKAMH